MSLHDSWPPVSFPVQSTAARAARWAWIPAIVAIPAIGWGAYRLCFSESTPTQAAQSNTSALDSLVPKRPNPTVEAVPGSPKDDPVNVAEHEVSDDMPLGEKPGIDDLPVDDPNPENDPGHGANNDSDLAAAGAADDADDGVGQGDERQHSGAEDGSESAVETDDGFWIQVASLRVQEKAERLAEQLRDRGYKAQAQAYGGPRAGWWHVVRIGPYLTRLDAETARLEFVSKERASSTMVLPKAQGPYYVQLASVRSKQRAKSLERLLRRRGHLAHVQSIGSKNRGMWHIVRVGPFDFESDAIGYRKLLEQRDDVSGDIVPRPTLHAAPVPTES